MGRKRLAHAVVLSFPLVCLVVLWPARRAQSFQSPDTFSKTVQPFFADNCYACHNSELKTAKLDLESYKTSDTIIQDHDVLGRTLPNPTPAPMPAPGS